MKFSSLDRYSFYAFDSTIFGLLLKWIAHMWCIYVEKKQNWSDMRPSRRQTGFPKLFQATIIIRNIVGLVQSMPVLCWFNQVIVHWDNSCVFSTLSVTAPITSVWVLQLIPWENSPSRNEPKWSAVCVKRSLNHQDFFNTSNHISESRELILCQMC